MEDLKVHASARAVSMVELAQTLVNGLSDASIYVMLAVGLSLIFGVMGVINFAQGDFMTLSAYVGYAVVTGFGVATGFALLVSVPALAAAGALFYFLVLRPTESYPADSRLLATFGVALFLEGIFQLVWTATPLAVHQSVGVVAVAGVRIPDSSMVDFGVAAVSISLLLLLLYQTSLGRSIRAASQDPVGAELIGIDTVRVKLYTTVVAISFTSIGGFMALTSSSLYPQLGFNLILTGFAVVIMGGLGSVIGVVIGSLLLGVVTELMSTYVASAYATVVPFVVIALVLFIRPSGLISQSVRYGGSDGGFGG